MAEEKVEEPFLTWVLMNQQAIKDGSAVYEGERVTLSSEGVRFETCVSVLIMTMRKKSPMLLAGSSQAKQCQVASTLLSLLVGWWGVPFGIIFTPFVVANNLWGGDKTTVTEILAIAENPDLAAKKTGNVGKVMLIFIFGVIGIILLLGLIFKIFALVNHAVH